MHPHQPTRADTLLRHLGREESLLRDALTNVAALRDALRRGDLPAALTLSAQQAKLGEALRDAAASRATAAAELAREVSLSAEGVTLSSLATKLIGTPAAELLAARGRLTAVAAELGAAHAQNANLITHLRSFFRGALAGLTDPEAPRRYGPSGSRLEPAGGLIEARG